MEKKENGILDGFLESLNLTKKKDKVILKQDEYELLKRQASKKGAYRRFDAVKSSMFNSNYGGSGIKIDNDLYNDLPRLVDLARTLEQNNPIMKKYLTMVENNLVGPTGFVLNVQGGDFKDNKKELDTIGNNVIEEHYEKWGKSRFCDITKKNSFKEMQRILARTLKRDGEILVRIIRCKANRENPYGFSLQLLDPQRLDNKQNTRLKNGNVLFMGVEMTDYGKPVAYHLRKSKNNNSLHTGSYDGEQIEIVPARDIIHKFKSLSQEQNRGVPDSHSVMHLMITLDEFMRAALIASQIGAASSIYLERETENGNTTVDALADVVDEDEVDELQNFAMEIDPATIRVLPPGVTMKTFQGNYPEANFVSYVSFNLKLIASGLNVSYFNLVNSYNEINFSAAKVGLQEERESWMREHDWFIENFMEVIYEDWLETALLNNAITFPNGNRIPASKIDKFLSYKYHGRKWPYIDPSKDISAQVKAIEHGLTTRTRVLAENGIDIVDILMERKREQELEILYGVKLDTSKNEGGNNEVVDMPEVDDVQIIPIEPKKVKKPDEELSNIE